MQCDCISYFITMFTVLQAVLATRNPSVCQTRELWQDA